eukprot:14806052-Alexandrium_andersonii.AAC.1
MVQGCLLSPATPLRIVLRQDKAGGVNGWRVNGSCGTKHRALALSRVRQLARSRALACARVRSRVLACARLRSRALACAR